LRLTAAHGTSRHGNVCRCGAATVELPPLAAPVDQLWHVLLDLGGEFTVPWTLVGGQVVLLLTFERGQVPPQISQDGDVVADIRSPTRDRAGG
jgi:hypothetical protein